MTTATNIGKYVLVSIFYNYILMDQLQAQHTIDTRLLGIHPITMVAKYRTEAICHLLARNKSECQ